MTTRTLGFALLFILVLTPVALAAQEQGTWHRLPAAPITPDFNRTSVWTGKEMLVFGRDQQTALDANGNPYATKSLNVAAAYNPRTDTWRSLDPPRATTGFMNLSSVWTGKEMLVWVRGHARPSIRSRTRGEGCRARASCRFTTASALWCGPAAS